MVSPRPIEREQSLGTTQIDGFIRDGYIKIENAFPAKLGEAVRDVLWRDLGLDRGDPSTWQQPVVRLGMYDAPPFVEAAKTPRLTAAYDDLVGEDRWLAPRVMGTFPIRFPSTKPPRDDGWHVDMSFDWHKPDFMDWRINLASRGRALLMLFLFSDVGESDAPTRIRRGSHRDVARMLVPAGDTGLTMRELVDLLPQTEPREELHATGSAGTVYLCHPFLVHASQAHRGKQPRFLAQPPLLPREDLRLDRADGAYSPVEIAIRDALN